MVRVLLLENIHPIATKKLTDAGHIVESLSSSLSEEALMKKLDEVDILGVRSSTQVSSTVLRNANHLLAIGCFCIGTNQVDLETAEELAIPVFNSPYANSRSVSELIIGQIIALSRQLGDRNIEMHTNTWQKTSKNCHEIRGKTLGIVGYGHIGSQLSVLAENIGMKVIYFDVLKKMTIGNAQSMPTMEALLARSDFVSLHVPLLPSTQNLIGDKEIRQMKYGSYLLNASRGNVVVLEDVAKYLERGHLLGFYADVFPVEPGANGSIPPDSPIAILYNKKNVILTPHIGGATEQAQEAIADEVTDRFLDFITKGSTEGSVNFPQMSPPVKSKTCYRIVNIHHNISGVLRDLTKILDQYNISYQLLATTTKLGVAVIDIDVDTGEDPSTEVTMRAEDILAKVSFLDSNIKTRVLI